MQSFGRRITLQINTDDRPAKNATLTLAFW